MVQHTENGANVSSGMHNLTPLASSVFGKLSSWKALSLQPIIEGQLALEMLGEENTRLVWTSPLAHRPNRDQPSRVRLCIPHAEIESQSAWDFRSALLTNFLASGAQSANEPIKSQFFRQLMQRGYEVTNLSNCSITDASIDLRLASSATLSNLSINVETTLKCQELNLQEVSIKDCKITFEVVGGNWHAVHVTGEKTQLMGRLGRTKVDPTCTFSDCYFGADCTAVDFGDDPNGKLRGTRFSHGGAPTVLLRTMRPLSVEEAEAMHAMHRNARWSVVSDRPWENPTDRNVDDRLESKPGSDLKGVIEDRKA